MYAGSVDGNHDVGGLDDRVGLLALLQLQVIHGFVGDRSRHNRSADIDANMRRGLALLHLNNRSLQQISSTELLSIVRSGLESLADAPARSSGPFEQPIGLRFREAGGVDHLSRNGRRCHATNACYRCQKMEEVS